MTAARATASLLPPVPRTTAAPFGTAAPAPAASLETPRALFDLGTLQLAPSVQREAALDAEGSGLDDETAVQPQLEVGPVEDAYEREADGVADAVMRMPHDRPEVRRQAEEDTEEQTVQRKCAACARDDEVQRQEVEASAEDEEMVQRRSVAAVEAERGPPTLAASPATLTSGGAPLPEATRRFFEVRLGHDLSEVRLHTGAPAADRARSIDARAFTYENHVWLGEGDARPSHTLAHELTHVLQQTGPGPLDDDARLVHGADTTVQRSAARFEPVTPPPTRAHWHDKVVEEVSRHNADILAEVPIPNAGTRGSVGEAARSPGFADFYAASGGDDAIPIPGVQLVGAGTRRASVPTSVSRRESGADTESEEVAEADTPESAPPPAAGDEDESALRIANFNRGRDWGRIGRRSSIILHDGEPTGVNGRQFPRVRNRGGVPTVVDLDRAPRNVSIGELKPGHNARERERGAERQAPRYRDALAQVGRAVDRANARDGSWGLGTPGLMSSSSALTVPRKLSYNNRQASRDFDRQIRLILRNGREPPRRLGRMQGELVFGLDPNHASGGVWTYVWMPADRRRTARGTARGEPPALRGLAQTLDRLLADLRRSPSHVRRRRRRRSRPRADGRGRVRRVRRDNFRFGDWNRDRLELRSRYRRFLNRDLRSASSLQLAEQIEEAWEQILGDIAMPGFTPPRLSPEARTSVRKMRRIERLSGRPGRVLGRLRERFGALFIRVANAYDRFRDRLQERRRRLNRAGSLSGFGGGGWQRTVLRILFQAVKTGAGMLIADVARRFATCLDAAAERVGEDLVQTLEQDNEAELEAARARIDAIVESFDGLAERIETEAEPILQRFDPVIALLEDADEIQVQRLLRPIEVAVRAGVLAASCAGAGIGCVAGALGQLAIPEIIAWAVSRPGFQEAFINPIVRDAIRPLGAQTYGQMLDVFLGEADAPTTRGRLRAFLDELPACAAVSDESVFRTSGFGRAYPAMGDAERNAFATGMVADYVAEHGEAVRRAIREQLVDPSGEPVTDDQIDRLSERLAEQDISVERARRDFDRARRPDGRVDIGRIGAARSGAASEAEGAREGEAGEGPPPPTLRLEYHMDRGSRPGGGRIEFFPGPDESLRDDPDEDGGAAPVIRVRF